MSRNWFINGESMVYVKGPAGSLIANLQELGLSDNPIQITMVPKHKDINLDAWGEAPADVQFKLAEVIITMGLIHFDPLILMDCVRLSMGGAAQFGRMARAGTLMGGAVPRFHASNKLVGVTIASPQEGLPWRFLTCYLAQPIGQWPLGTEKSVVQLQFRCIPYTYDPWQGGAGASNWVLFDNIPDS